jgi:hypothetical protein
MIAVGMEVSLRTTRMLRARRERCYGKCYGNVTECYT